MKPQKKHKLPLLISLLFYFFFFPAQSLFGQYQDFFGLGARSSSMAGSMTALATDHSAVYYNPAGLAFSKPVEIVFSSEYLHLDNFDVSVEKDKQAEKDAEKMDYIFGVNLGLSLSFGRKEKVIDPLLPCESCGTPVRASASKCPKCGAEFEPMEVSKKTSYPPFGFGINIFLPFKDLVEASALDSRVPRPYFYQRNLRKVGLVVGGAFRPLKNLSFGAGAALLADAHVTTEISQPLGGSVNVDFTENLVGDIAPVVGIRYSPIKGLWLGITYRGELSLKVDAIASTVVGGVTFFFLKLQSITLFTPHQVAFGASYQIFPNFLAALDITWYNWSRFKTTANYVENQPGSLALNTENPPEIGTRDIVAFRMGAEWTFLPKWIARFGYYYYPAIVKEQTRESTVLDTDRHVVSLGASHSFLVMGIPNTLDVYMAFHYLPKRTNQKSDPTDPYGTTSMSAFLIALGFTLKMEF
ncbi:MAG: hypothetical protein D6785_06645 [Planctomycetota bacterium]|nr:MAG: hypothetical protein D6785_06645 [Planctomycetota bacterium]